jgi:hypothetical protein
VLNRATRPCAALLAAHLTTIVICFAVAPYTRFAHAVYRFLAMVADNIERPSRVAAPGVSGRCTGRWERRDSP